MRDEDRIDTEPVIMTGRTAVVFESLDLEPGERGEIVLAPDRPFSRPTLFMADRDRKGRIVIEAIFHGKTAIGRLGQCQADMYRFGRRLDVVASRDEPVKIVIINNNTQPANMGASLVDTPDDAAPLPDPGEPKGRE